MLCTWTPRRESSGFCELKGFTCYVKCLYAASCYMDTAVTTLNTIYRNYWFRGVMSSQRSAACRRGWEMPGLHVWRAVTFISYFYFSRMLLKLSLQIHWELQIPSSDANGIVTLIYLETAQTEGAVGLFWCERGKAVNVFWAAALGHEGHWSLSQLSLWVKDRNTPWTGHQSITAHIIYSHSHNEGKSLKLGNYANSCPSLTPSWKKIGGNSCKWFVLSCCLEIIYIGKQFDGRTAVLK